VSNKFIDERSVSGPRMLQHPKSRKPGPHNIRLIHAKVVADVKLQGAVKLCVQGVT
jgi:hypothetical protein